MVSCKLLFEAQEGQILQIVIRTTKHESPVIILAFRFILQPVGGVAWLENHCATQQELHARQRNLRFCLHSNAPVLVPCQAASHDLSTVNWRRCWGIKTHRNVTIRYLDAVVIIYTVTRSLIRSRWKLERLMCESGWTSHFSETRVTEYGQCVFNSATRQWSLDVFLWFELQINKWQQTLTAACSNWRTSDSWLITDTSSTATWGKDRKRLKTKILMYCYYMHISRILFDAGAFGRGGGRARWRSCEMTSVVSECVSVRVSHGEDRAGD